MKRSKIILLAAQATSNKDIALKLGIHHNTVSLWRRRFIDSESVLAFVEAELPDDLKELLTTILSDEYRSGAPRTYSSNVRSRIKIVACQNPEDYGFTISHWNLPCLRLALIDAGIVDDISYGQYTTFSRRMRSVRGKSGTGFIQKKNTKTTRHTKQRYRL